MEAVYRIVVHRRAARYLNRLPAPQHDRLKEALGRLAYFPADLHDVRAMQGEWQGYRRIRLGEMRIIFWVDEKARTIYVDHIGPRGDIY